jgi:putative chitobiose transport system substrate-binding protein
MARLDHFKHRPAWRVLGLLALLLPQAALAQTLVFWTMQLAPFHNDYIHGVIAAFERQHPGVKVRWVDVPWAEMERKALTAMAAGTAPDVLNLNPQFSAKLAEFGALAEPERYLSPADVASYLPSAWRANSLGGKTFALPWYMSTNVTLVNRSVMARAGVAVPADWPALMLAAQQLRERGAGYAYFLAMDGSAPLEALAATSRPAMPLVSVDGCAAAFDIDATTAFFDSYRRLYQAQLVPRNVLTEGHRTAVTMFLSGQVAMISTGMQFLQQVKTSNPALYAQIDVAPQLGAGQANLAVMNLAVPTRSAHPALAFAFARFVTNAENQLALMKRVPLLPSSAASYDDAFFTTPTGDAVLDAARSISMQQARDGAVLVPPVRRYSALRASFVRKLQASMLGRISPADAVRDVAQEWRALLGCQR